MHDSARNATIHAGKAPPAENFVPSADAPKRIHGLDRRTYQYEAFHLQAAEQVPRPGGKPHRLRRGRLPRRRVPDPGPEGERARGRGHGGRACRVHRRQADPALLGGQLRRAELVALERRQRGPRRPPGGLLPLRDGRAHPPRARAERLEPAPDRVWLLHGGCPRRHRAVPPPGPLPGLHGALRHLPLRVLLRRLDELHAVRQRRPGVPSQHAA